MLWVQSFLQFLGDALRPIRRVSGVAQELGISVIGIAGIAAIRNDHGWVWAALFVAAGLASAVRHRACPPRTSTRAVNEMVQFGPSRVKALDNDSVASLDGDGGRQPLRPSQLKR